MVNMLQAVYIATAALLLLALVRFVMSRRATGIDRAILTEKARRYFILSGVFGIASIGGYTVLDEPAAAGPRVDPVAAASIASPNAPSGVAPASAAGDVPAFWTLVPGRGAVGIGPDATHETLRARLGDSVVVGEQLDVDGRRVNGTVIFPADPLRRIEVVWGDAARRERPVELRVRGQASRWRLPSGETLGAVGADGAPIRELRVPVRP